MDAQKAEFKRLIKSMGWSQTEAAKRLGKTPSAINHLVNSDHPNKPTESTLRLLKLIIARERPHIIQARTVKLEPVATCVHARDVQMNADERDLIHLLRGLTAKEQKKICAAIRALLLLARGRKNRKNN
jgi:transcriptional regulator with XRE-family HTH domain